MGYGSVRNSGSNGSHDGAVPVVVSAMEWTLPTELVSARTGLGSGRLQAAAHGVTGPDGTFYVVDGSGVAHYVDPYGVAHSHPDGVGQ